MLVLNAVAVGVAIGAYGSRVIEATALHLALELAALSLAGGAYTAGAHASPCARGRSRSSLRPARLLLALAATLETYVPIGAPR